MARHLRRRFSGAKYHVTNRGNGRQVIFADGTDCERFVEQLADAVRKDSIILYAYCLMPNHFHLFLETPQANLGRFMGRLTTAYAMYWRHRHRKPGHCFQSRYKAPLVEGDDYAVALTRYIHLNPVKTKSAWGLDAATLWRQLQEYPWSSLHGYLDRKRAAEMVDYCWLKVLGDGSTEVGRQRYAEYLKGFLVQDDEEMLKTMSAGGVYAIGDEEFRREVAEWALEQGKRRRKADVTLPADTLVDIGRIERAVCAECGIEVGALRRKSARIGVAREFVIELGCSIGGLTQRAMGERLGGVTEHAVCKARQRFIARLAADDNCRRGFNRLKEQMSSV
jgi:REP element-mobilizing transposase RayT